MIFKYEDKHNYFSINLIRSLTNLIHTLIGEPEGLKLLIPQPRIGKYPQPVSSTSHPHNLLLYEPCKCYSPISSVSQMVIFYKISTQIFCMHSLFLSSLIHGQSITASQQLKKVLSAIKDPHITLNSEQVFKFYNIDIYNIKY
jgi:hypothetical protein